MYRLPEYCINYLGSGVLNMSSKISLGSIVIIPLRPKVSSIREGHHHFPLSLLLILLDLFVLVNPIH